MTPEDLVDAGLLFTVEGPVATVTLDRPEVRNAQTPLMWRTLAAIGEQIPDDVRVVLVRGRGSPSPPASTGRCSTRPAGARARRRWPALLAKPDDEIFSTIDAFQRGFTWLRDPRFVSIAVVQGHAIGAGFQLALACDLRVLADDAQLCMKESALGLVPDLTGTKPLVEAVGYARALEICSTARMVSADEAVQIGLASVAVPAADLDATVSDLVGALTAAMPGAVREIKALLQGASGRDLDEQRRFEREAQVRRFRELASLLESYSRIPRLVSSTVRRSPPRNSLSRRGLSVSPHRISEVVQAAARAVWMPNAAKPSSTRPASRSTVAMTPLENQSLISSCASASTSLVRVKSLCCGVPHSGTTSISWQVWTTAMGRSWQMCAFIPASANWIGRVFSRLRPSKSGSQAGLIGVPARSAAYASKKRLAKCTSSRSRNSPASKLSTIDRDGDQPGDLGSTSG